jgi:hypothetical protein
MAFAFVSLLRVGAAFASWCAIAHALAKRTPRRSECGSVYGTHATLGHGPAVDALARDELWIVSQPTYNEKIS